MKSILIEKVKRRNKQWWDKKHNSRFTFYKRGKTYFIEEGMKRSVSILGVLIIVYNQCSVCLAIDELDSGIFEYLLGEILEVLSNEIKVKWYLLLIT